jgi:hypothetical protein
MQVAGDGGKPGTLRVSPGAAMPLTQLLIFDQKFRYQSLQPCIFNLQLENLF